MKGIKASLEVPENINHELIKWGMNCTHQSLEQIFGIYDESNIPSGHNEFLNALSNEYEFLQGFVRNEGNDTLRHSADIQRNSTAQALH